MAVVYMATNKVNGKRYIGVTMHALRTRISQHKSDAIGRHRQSRFHAAIRKYGFCSFEWVEIFQCQDIKEALKMEIEIIADQRPEYNISAGGEGRTSPLSESAKKKLMGNKNASGNKSSRDRVITKEYRKNLSNALKNSESLRRRAVICLDTGILYKSISEAGEKLGIDWTAIQKVCSGRKYNKTARGLRFAFYIGKMEKAS